MSQCWLWTILLMLSSSLAWGQVKSLNPDNLVLKNNSLKYDTPMQVDLFSGPLSPVDYIFDYEIGDQGRSIRIGQAELNNNTFKVSLSKAEDSIKGLSRAYGNANDEALYFFWPQALMQESVVEAITKTGQMLWEFNLDSKKISQWQNQLQSIKVQYAPEDKVLNSDFFRSQYAIQEPQKVAAFLWRRPETFRFCFSQRRGTYRTSLCTPYIKAKQSGSNVQLSYVASEDVEQKVLINNVAADPVGSFVMDITRPILFYAQLLDGLTIESINSPRKMDLYQVKESPKDSSKWLISGIGTRPLGIKVNSTVAPESFFTKLIGFESTIGDQRDFWQAEILKNDSKIYVPGESGSMFLYPLKVNWLPSGVDIPNLKQNTQKATYVSSPQLSLRALPPTYLASSAKLVQKDKKSKIYNWHFDASQEGQVNRSYLNVNTEKGTYRAFYELYRGYPTEISARLTGIVATSGSYVFLGELAYNHWFERLFGWDQYYFSTLRWGVSAKLFQTFSKFDIGDDEEGERLDASLNVTTVDLKYRLTPGLWGRDETWGAMLSYQDLKFNEIQTTMIGGGVFWARSMPRIIDNLFNLFAYMNYPKWVDFEFIYYPVGLNSEVEIENNYSINFHGKIMWSEHFFGEAGFGIKSYSLADSISERNIEIATFYGTVGLGWSF